MAAKQKLTEQGKRFVEAANDVDVDDDPEAFRERLKKLVNAPTPKSVSDAPAGRNEFTLNLLWVRQLDNCPR